MRIVVRATLLRLPLIAFRQVAGAPWDAGSALLVGGLMLLGVAAGRPWSAWISAGDRRGLTTDPLSSPLAPSQAPRPTTAAKGQAVWDVDVIGAGLGGLTAAALLALARARVAVFEQHDKPGGFSHCREGVAGQADGRRPVFRFDGGVDEVSDYPRATRPPRNASAPHHGAVGHRGLGHDRRGHAGDAGRQGHAPTSYFNVPKGFEEIARAMDGDSLLRDTLFSRVKAFTFAGAGQSQAGRDRLDRHAEAAIGQRIGIFPAWA